MSDKFKAIVLNQSGDKFLREIKVFLKLEMFWLKHNTQA